MECKECGSPKVENAALMLCASCARAMRKAMNLKVKPKPQRIAKASGKLAKLLERYSKERDQWIVGKKCAVYPNERATDVHHKRGRSFTEFADDWAREHNVPLLLDKRFWLPVCREAHLKITMQSQWALDNGYSELRLAK